LESISFIERRKLETNISQVIVAQFPFELTCTSAAFVMFKLRSKQKLIVIGIKDVQFRSYFKHVSRWLELSGQCRNLTDEQIWKLFRDILLTICATTKAVQHLILSIRPNWFYRTIISMFFARLIQFGYDRNPISDFQEPYVW
jgi:hypothetical protein